jgi:hypothetical protein
MISEVNNKYCSQSSHKDKSLKSFRRKLVRYRTIKSMSDDCTIVFSTTPKQMNV